MRHPIRHLLLGLLLAGLTAGAHAGFTLDQLMAGLAANTGGRVKFVEKRYLALLDRPLVSTGEMAYTPPDRLEKRTLTPKPETLILDRDRVRVERDRRSYSVSLASRPEALAFVDSVRGTLAGDRAALEKNYRLQLEGDEHAWLLTLTPTAPAVAELLRSIRVSGSGGQIHAIAYLLRDGDRSELSIEPIAAP